MLIYKQWTSKAVCFAIYLFCRGFFHFRKTDTQKLFLFPRKHISNSIKNFQPAAHLVHLCFIVACQAATAARGNNNKKSDRKILFNVIIKCTAWNIPKLVARVATLHGTSLKWFSLCLNATEWTIHQMSSGSIAPAKWLKFHVHYLARSAGS